ncbi:MAG: hypothetical protein AMK69_24365 [Nitrospira bacterium SG8_3]|jgi:hypothetical protein|nr:MAG: hypothetical protein AMK69_24365 [Nitrospira bacterium SG8_3]
MTEEYGKSTELSREFDIVEELEKTVEEIEKAFEILETDEVPDKLSYLRFLVRDLDSLFQGDNENLRYRKFKITRFK